MRGDLGVGRVLILIVLLFVVFFLVDGTFAALRQAGTDLAASTILLIRLIAGWSLVLVLAWRSGGGSFRATFLLVPASATLSAAGLFMGLGLSLAILSLVTWIPFPPPESSLQLGAQFSATNQASLAVAMLLVGPVAEELFFRGAVLHAWKKRYGVRFAVLGTTIFFAGLHVLSAQILVALPLGFILAWTVLKTDSIVPAILGHIGANAAPRLFDPILLLAGNTDSQIELMDRLPLWITCVGVTLLLGGAMLTVRPARVF